jgi:hypothetical protein
VIPWIRTCFAEAVDDGAARARTGSILLCVRSRQGVPTDHLIGQIDGALDLDWVHKELAPYYSQTGRPSIDPVLMIRTLIVGYVFAIRSGGGCALRRRSVWHIDGFASSVSRMEYPTILYSAVPGMSAFARATRYAGYLRA